MFRRIELIHQLTSTEYRAFLKAVRQSSQASQYQLIRFWKSGLLGTRSLGVAYAWSELNSPRRSLYKNCRFFFTEDGWNRYGREAISACQKTGQEYRVIRIKERSVDVMYRDAYQVAVRPRKKMG